MSLAADRGELSACIKRAAQNRQRKNVPVRIRIPIRVRLTEIGVQCCDMIARPPPDAHKIAPHIHYVGAKGECADNSVRIRAPIARLASLGVQGGGTVARFGADGSKIPTDVNLVAVNR